MFYNRIKKKTKKKLPKRNAVKSTAVKKTRKSKTDKEKPVIKFIDVVKVYKLYKKRKLRILDVLAATRNYRLKTAVDHVSFKIKRGESVAILGLNGAGKSTILKMITKVVFPTSGKVKVRGKVGALLELTTGFDPNFTGKENIFIKGMLLGLSRREIKQLLPKIVKFADIGEYIDQPVRTYSSGMKMRLGFAINVNIEPDILIIDEALAVGDRKFQEKCKAKIDEVRSRENVTVILVTHSMESAERICQRGLVLSNGKLVFDGKIEAACKFYKDMTK